MSTQTNTQPAKSCSSKRKPEKAAVSESSSQKKQKSIDEVDQVDTQSDNPGTNTARRPFYGVIDSIASFFGVLEGPYEFGFAVSITVDRQTYKGVVFKSCDDVVITPEMVSSSLICGNEGMRNVPMEQQKLTTSPRITPPVTSLPTKNVPVNTTTNNNGNNNPIISVSSLVAPSTYAKTSPSISPPYPSPQSTPSLPPTFHPLQRPIAADSHAQHHSSDVNFVNSVNSNDHSTSASVIDNYHNSISRMRLPVLRSLSPRDSYSSYSDDSDSQRSPLRSPLGKEEGLPAIQSVLQHMDDTLRIASSPQHPPHTSISYSQQTHIHSPQQSHIHLPQQIHIHPPQQAHHIQQQATHHIPQQASQHPPHIQQHPTSFMPLPPQPQLQRQKQRQKKRQEKKVLEQKQQQLNVSSFIHSNSNSSLLPTKVPLFGGEDVVSAGRFILQQLANSSSNPISSVL